MIALYCQQVFTCSKVRTPTKQLHFFSYYDVTQQSSQTLKVGGVFCCLFLDFDGLFISNGPGDPQLCQTTISNVRKVVCVERPKPVFGICLGHQLLSLVIGSKTFKMKLVPRTHTHFLVLLWSLLHYSLHLHSHLHHIFAANMAESV